MAGLSIGTILLWAGSIVGIPVGWKLCDGNNGTPDLRDKFIIGAGNTYPVDAVGGNSEHSHTFVTDGHAHGMIAGTDVAAGVNRGDITTDAWDTGTTQNTNHLPPYHALSYIMRT